MIASTSNHLAVGIDLVLVSRIKESLDDFGERFLTRIFTKDEAAYAMAADSELTKHQRLAARFAAKEAALKALDLVDEGVSKRDLEVVKTASGACELWLHGRARELVPEHANTTLSLSHEGDVATAVVIAYSSRSSR